MNTFMWAMIVIGMSYGVLVLWFLYNIFVQVNRCQEAVELWTASYIQSSKFTREEHLAFAKLLAKLVNKEATTDGE